MQNTMISKSSTPLHLSVYVTHSPLFEITLESMPSMILFCNWLQLWPGLSDTSFWWPIRLVCCRTVACTGSNTGSVSLPLSVESQVALGFESWCFSFVPSFYANVETMPSVRSWSSPATPRTERSLGWCCHIHWKKKKKIYQMGPRPSDKWGGCSLSSKICFK